MRFVSRVIILLVINVLLDYSCANLIFEWNNPIDLLREDINAPGEVTNLTAESGDRYIRLSWANPIDEDFDYVEIWYGIGNTDIIFTGEIRPEGTILADLENDNEYTVRVITSDNLDNKSEGIILNIFTLDTIPPENVENLLVYSGNNRALISWKNPENDFSHVEIWYGIDTPDTLYQGAADPSGTVITNILNHNEYIVLVYSVDYSGKLSTGTQVTVIPDSIDFLEDVFNLSARFIDGNVTLSWTLPEDEVISHVEIWYGEQLPEYKYTGTIDSNTVDISGLDNNKEYIFKVVVFNDVGNRSVGSTCFAAQLVGSQVLDKNVLYWGDNFNDSLEFYLEKSIDNNIYEVLDYSITAEDETYSDFAIEKGITYYYRIRVVNSLGDIKYSNVVSIEVLLGLGITIDNQLEDQLEISITDHQNYIIYGDDLTITASQIDGAIYQWYLDGILLSNENSNIITIGSKLGYGSYILSLIIHANNIYSSRETSFIIRAPQIGDYYQGGIVFYIYDEGGGLIASQEDQYSETAIVWNNGHDIEIGTETGIGTGKENTNLIVSLQGEGDYAAKIAYDLILNGYDDWFLPSKDELNEMYLNKNLIGGFPSNNYWSSSESVISHAWNQRFDDYGSQNSYPKDATYISMRCIREFFLEEVD